MSPESSYEDVECFVGKALCLYPIAVEHFWKRMIDIGKNICDHVLLLVYDDLRYNGDYTIPDTCECT